jgi:hypothetical protein
MFGGFCPNDIKVAFSTSLSIVDLIPNSEINFIEIEIINK